MLHPQSSQRRAVIDGKSRRHMTCLRPRPSYRALYGKVTSASVLPELCHVLGPVDVSHAVANVAHVPAEVYGRHVGHIAYHRSARVAWFGGMYGIDHLCGYMLELMF